MSKKIGGKVLAGILAVTALAGGATYVSVENGKKQYDAGYEKGYDKGHDKGYNEGLKIEVGYSEEEVQKKIEEALNSQKVGQMIDFSKIGATTIAKPITLANGNKFFILKELGGLYFYNSETNSLERKWDTGLETEANNMGTIVNKNGVYLREGSSLIFFDGETGTPCVISETDIYFSSKNFGNGTFVSVGGKTLYYDLSTKQVELISGDYEIKALNLVEGGAFYYTSTNDLYFVNSKTKEVSFVEHDSLERGGMGFVEADTGVYICVGTNLYTYDFITKERSLISTTFSNLKGLYHGNDALCIVDNGLSYYNWNLQEFTRVSDDITSIPNRINNTHAFYSTATFSCLIDLQTLEITELSPVNGYAISSSNCWVVENGFVYKAGLNLVALNAETKQETVICSAAGMTIMEAQDGLFLQGSGTSPLPGLRFIDGKTFEVSIIDESLVYANKCIDLGNGYLLEPSTYTTWTGVYFVDAETKSVKYVHDKDGWVVKANFEGGVLFSVDHTSSTYCDGVLLYDKDSKSFKRFEISGTMESLLFVVEADGVHIVNDNSEYVFDKESKEMKLLKQYAYVY